MKEVLLTLLEKWSSFVDYHKQQSLFKVQKFVPSYGNIYTPNEIIEKDELKRHLIGSLPDFYLR